MKEIQEEDAEDLLLLPPEPPAVRGAGVEDCFVRKAWGDETLPAEKY